MLTPTPTNPISELALRFMGLSIAAEQAAARERMADEPDWYVIAEQSAIAQTWHKASTMLCNMFHGRNFTRTA